MNREPRSCPDCGDPPQMARRTFLTAAGATAAAVSLGLPATARAAEEPAKSAPESLVKTLYGTLTPKQKETICFAWDHQDPKRGLLRTRISNNWHITEPIISSEFYTKDQQQLVRAIFEGIIQPDWQKRVDKQLQDDAGGWGKSQNIAIFGNPNDGKFELVITGRHMTLRCDGNSTEHMAFGGPIFYGHAASGFYEKPGHPNNVYWPQAQAAGSVYSMLDGKQRAKALIESSPEEIDVAFKSEQPGIRVGELSKDQQENVQKVLQKLLEPYRQSDRDEVGTCLKAQGGLEACHLAFFKEGDLNPSDNDWDIWRLQGPSFVWSFRGVPHVHVWVNISDSPKVALNSASLG